MIQLDIISFKNHLQNSNLPDDFEVTGDISLEHNDLVNTIFLKNGQIIGNLTIHHCNTNHDIVLSNLKVLGNIQFVRNTLTFANIFFSITLNNVTAKCIHFNNNSIGNLVLKQVIVSDKFVIENNTNINAVNILESSFIKLVLNENTTSSEVVISCDKKPITITAKNNTFKDKFHLIRNESQLIFECDNSNFLKNFIYDSQNEINEEKTTISFVKLKSEKDSRFEFLTNNTKRLVLGSLSLDFSKDSPSELFLENLMFGELRFSGTNSQTNLFIKDVEVTNWTLDHFYNTKEIALRNFTANKNQHGKFKCISSNTGKFVLIGCYFQSFDTLEIQKSTFSDWIPIHVDWFSKTAVNNTYIGKLKVDSNAWRQLKMAASKYNRIDEALEFKRNEFKTYRLEQIVAYGRLRDYLKLKKHRSKHSFFERYYGKKNRFILWASSLNSFGKNWFRPILYILLITVLSYGIIICFLSTNTLTLNLSNEWHLALPYYWNVFLSNFHLYWQMLDPINRLHTTLPKADQENNYIMFFDIVHRICYAFLIYQVIKAFRKFIDEK